MMSVSVSRISLASQNSMDDLNLASDATALQQYSRGENHIHHHHAHKHDKLLLQVAEWLQREKAKRASRKTTRSSKDLESGGEEKETDVIRPSRPRTASQGSDSSLVSLDKLQRILEDNMSGYTLDTLPHPSPSLAPRRSSQVKTRRLSARKLNFQSSDTEYQDGDVIVPSCDVILDNSKTMSYSGGAAGSSNETVTLSTSKRAEKERKAWLSFKSEILRLAHTLRLKGWRRVPLEMGADIGIMRLSGALTNAVYVVSPPTDLPVVSDPNTSTQHKPRPPQKLLLRIYGPQVEHLIDRENELGILRRLARKKIGPRLLGTFRNGRFEEFYNAQTLTTEDLRDVATSKQIAKRMRELHEGVELLPREREEGPFVWKNWNKWVDRCQEIIQYLDREILNDSKKKKGEPWRERGLVCGVEWGVFKSVIDQYRKWLEDYYRAKGGVMRSLVFAHNDVRLFSPSSVSITTNTNRRNMGIFCV
jgi:choline kinase